MKKDIQKLLFNNSIDMEQVSKEIRIMVSNIEKVGKPKHLSIEIKSADEFKPDITLNEVAEVVDKEHIQKGINRLDIVWVWKQNDQYVIVGAKL